MTLPATWKGEIMNEQLYKRSPTAIFSQVGEDIVALNVQGGRCYGMEKVTAAVWNMLEKPISARSMCDRLLQIYDVEPEICRSDVARLLGEFQAEGIVDAVPGSESPAG